MGKIKKFKDWKTDDWLMLFLVAGTPIIFMLFTWEPVYILVIIIFACYALLAKISE